MSGLTVLLTNFELAIRGGSQLYVRDVALGLLRRGHTPVVYSPRLGGVAWELSEATIPVVDDLSRITATPDIIHGHHNHELLAAVLRFPGVPAVRVCHGWADEVPQPFPRVLRYIAVDDTTRDRCLYEWGVPADRVDVLLNFVDLSTFMPRAPLPRQPQRALVFSNTARGHLPVVTAACQELGLAIDVVGHDAGNATANPERVLPQYDLVFAKARAAIEALATGTAVILCDAAGMGPMVTTANVERLRRLNFGVRTLSEPLSRDGIARELARYDPDDAQLVSERIRAVADADAAVDGLIETYRDVIAEHASRGPADASEDLRAASAYLERLAPRLRWAEDPRALRYLLLRSINQNVQRLPGIKSLVRAPWAQELVRGTRARWRSRSNGS